MIELKLMRVILPIQLQPRVLAPQRMVLIVIFWDSRMYSDGHVLKSQW